MSDSILIEDDAEIEAVKNGEIDGDVYKDGDVYAKTASLLQWRELRAQNAA